VRVLITGSSGFIGRHLAEALQTAGHAVHRVVRSTPGPGDALIDLESHKLDCSRLENNSLDGIDVVFNLAGEPLTPRRWGREKRRAIYQSRIGTTEIIARAIATADTPPAAFVSMSATGYYGSRGEETLVEGSTAGTGFLAEVCRSWEAATAPARGRTRIVLARNGVVIGNGGALAVQVKLFRLGLGGRLGSGRQWLSWIAIEDEIAALVRAATDENIEGPTNFVAPTPVRNADFTATLARHLHRPAPFTVPRGALVAAVGRRVADELVLASQRVQPVRLTRAGFSYLRPTLDEAIRASLSSRH
jgi:uncharacterized protein (TIGR01777 family)